MHAFDHGKNPDTDQDASVILSLDRYCIETASKRTYEALIGRYFSKTSSQAEKDRIAGQIECLSRFVRRADFRVLRHAYPDLNGGNKLVVTVSTGDNENDTLLQWNGGSVTLKLG